MNGKEKDMSKTTKPKKHKKHIYLVDVFRYYGKCVEIEADNPEEAEDIAYEKTRNGEIDPSGFTMTDDIDATTCGYVDDDGEHHYN